MNKKSPILPKFSVGDTVYYLVNSDTQIRKNIIYGIMAYDEGFPVYYFMGEENPIPEEDLYYSEAQLKAAMITSALKSMERSIASVVHDENVALQIKNFISFYFDCVNHFKNIKQENEAK